MRNGQGGHRTDPESVTIVVPAKNEEEGIGSTLRSLPVSTLEAMGLEVQVFVVDGRSEDATREIARSHGADVMTQERSGKGAAVREAREQFEGDLVVMLDADGTYAADAIPRVVGPLVDDEADLVMGRRRPQPGSMSPSHRVGNALLSLEASVLYGRTCPDLCTGLWGFRADVLRALPLRCQGFELEADLFALSSRYDLRVEEVSVDYLPREGETKLGSARDGARIAWWLVRTRFEPLPAPARLSPSETVRQGEGGA